MLRPGPLVFALLAILVFVPVGSDPARLSPRSEKEAAIDYNHDVLPILSQTCFNCHGPAEKKSGLRLDIRAETVKPTQSGVVPIQPGHADASEVIRRIFAADDGERMPPPKSKKTLSTAQKEILRRWIDQGAEYKVHWAFVKPVKPTLPKIADPGWVKNEIDAFILARLESARLQPAQRADKATLIRRLSLDLRGLPPSLAELDAFLADQTPDAYEKLVDRMLASPRYGEKMALLWLDLARFGDTSGFHFDSTRQMWLWRDWVINAFNSNMPFDRFTIEQMAGDLLPSPPVPAKIATGFHRNTRFNEEGGADPEEFVIRYNVDRANTLGQVWLGLTLGCAECHNHKYDPISQKEYYQLFAFFTGIKEPMVSGNHNQPLPPLLKVPSAEQTKKLERLRQDLDELQRDFAGAAAKVNYNYFFLAANPATSEAFETFIEEWADIQTKIKAVEDAIPHTLITEEMPEPRPAYVLSRGDFLQPGERVFPATPTIVSPLPSGAPNNRLGLAQWLVSPDHPLTARVAVNRLWAQMFGSGIVASIGDFGTQGELPSHPELLDWLATEFMQSGWDIKYILKKIALSNTYQQSSMVPSGSVAIIDPHNKLLSRAPRFRLSAEEIRDNALAIAGLLSPKIGGPSVMPYQPPDFYKGKMEEWLWTPSAGEDQYRRGLYTFWRRTTLHPMFALFDAPTRTECTVARARTNTPVQALVTLNDPTFVEAARVFAQNILVNAPHDVDGRMTYAFRAALARLPSAAELDSLKARFLPILQHYQTNPDAASILVNVGSAPRLANLDISELAAWTALANILLNLDETITRE